jgi:hypothetical protein
MLRFCERAGPKRLPWFPSSTWETAYGHRLPHLAKTPPISESNGLSAATYILVIQRAHLSSERTQMYPPLKAGKPNCSDGVKVLGRDNPGFSAAKAKAIRAVLKREDWNKMKVACMAEGWLLSHAGFHPTWGEATLEGILARCASAERRTPRGQVDPILGQGNPPGVGRFSGPIGRISPAHFPSRVSVSLSVTPPARRFGSGISTTPPRCASTPEKPGLPPFSAGVSFASSA